MFFVGTIRAISWKNNVSVCFSRGFVEAYQFTNEEQLYIVYFYECEWD
jgi:hypothetical protein